MADLNLEIPELVAPNILHKLHTAAPTKTTTVTGSDKEIQNLGLEGLTAAKDTVAGGRGGRGELEGARGQRGPA